jgi:heme exporter protein D
MHDFWAMGGYAAYVWPAFAVTLVVMGGLAWHAWATRRRLRRALAALGSDAAGDRE